MAQDPSAMRSRRRWDPSYGAPGDAQRRMQRPVPSYAAHTISSGPQSRLRGYVNVKQDLPQPRRSSMPAGSYIPSQDIPDVNVADNIDPSANIDPSRANFPRHSSLENPQYVPTRSTSPENATQRYVNQYRSTASCYQPRVMFETNPPRNHSPTGYETVSYGLDYEKQMNDQIMDPVQRSIIDEAEEMVEQYEQEDVTEANAVPEVESYAVTPVDSQSSVESGEPSEAAPPTVPTNISSLERDLAKREKEERRQLHKDLKKWQKQRRKLFLSQSGEYARQENENYQA